MARPSKYYTHVEPRLKEIQAWARDGAKEEEIAKRLAVAYSTFREYKKQFLALSAALKEKDAYDNEVVESVHKNTLGGIVKLATPIKVKKKYFENGKLVREEEEVVMTTREEYVRPDTLAQMYWLYNRQPSKWKARPTEQPNPHDQEAEAKQKDELYEHLINRPIEGFNTSNDEQNNLQ